MYTINDLLTLMSRLREPEYGCPWDLAQSYKSIAPSTLEEAYEVVDAIESENLQQLKEELGDLLFQVIFYSQLAREDGEFTFEDIVSGITEKLLRRHPHVFPDGSLESRIDPDSQRIDRRQSNIKASWERIKEEERQQKGHHHLMDDIPMALPATARAVKLQKRAASVGFDWSSIEGVYDKLSEEILELQSASIQQNHDSIEEELGDVLFTAINLARHLKFDPDTALRKANKKFEGRFRQMEAMAEAQQQSLSDQSPAVLESWWQQIKSSLRF